VAGNTVGKILAVNGLHSEARPRVDVRIVGRRTAGGITNGFGTDSATTGDRANRTTMREARRRRAWLGR
jgi:hypothetical protein